MKNPVRTPQMHSADRRNTATKARQLEREVDAAQAAGAVSYQKLRALYRAKEDFKDLRRTSAWVHYQGGSFWTKKFDLEDAILSGRPREKKSVDFSDYGFRIARTVK